MKATLSGFLFFLVISLFYPAPDQPLYYWEGDAMHYFQIDTSITLIEFKVDRIEEQSLLDSYPEAEAYRIKDDSTIQLITRSMSKLLGKISAQDNIIQYPAIQVKETNGISFVTDEISIKFKNKKSESDLEGFADKLDLIHLMETSYGAHIFRVPDRVKTVSIANFIQENEQVIWSSPNFVHLISLFNDPLYPDQYYLNNIGQGGGTAGIDIDAPEAWEITLGCSDIRIR